MTNSDDTFPENDAQQPFDPLTAPTWMFETDDDILLAPPLEEFFSDFAQNQSMTSIVSPPNVDDIIAGEYTGWVPIIKAGESLAQAQERAEQISEVAVEDVVIQEVLLEIDSSKESIEIIEQTFSSDSIVADPDYVESPAKALEEARKRIAAMRASLQVNLNRVAESFEHPIFTQSTDEPPAEVRGEQAPAVGAPASPDVTAQVTDESILATTSEQLPDAQEQTAPETTRVYVPVESQLQPELDQSIAPQPHSLELMIMRDEIRDLRDRLDASQKLIEDLMHRLANLAELALRRNH
jgi:hypothetical protein